MVTHSHAFGTTSYLRWFEKTPSEAAAAAILDAAYEPDRDETLSVEGPVSLEELAGLQKTVGQ